MPTQKERAKSVVTEAIVHPLFGRNIQPIRNWHTWLDRWQTTEDFQWMESLLHVGYGVSFERTGHNEKEYDRSDRHIFYLNMANGWDDLSLLRQPGDSQTDYFPTRDSENRIVSLKIDQLRQRLVRKAFDMLCLNFFRMEFLGGGRRGEGFNEDWERLILVDKLFPAIMAFFWIEKEGRNRVEVHNLPRRLEKTHNEQHVLKFLIDLAKVMWLWEEYPIDKWLSKPQTEAKSRYNKEMRARLDGAKPWMIEILSQLDELGLLRKWIFKLDQSSLAKLKEIALRNELDHYTHPVTEDRPIANIDEACYIGSKAAWLLKEHELRTKEDKRLRAIVAAKRTQEEATQRIENLSK